MFDLNKKGLGESIATFALIVIAIGAVALAGYSLLTIMSIGDIQKSPEFRCLNDQFQLNQNSLPIRIANACYNSETKKTEIVVQRSEQGVQINSISFQIQDKTFSCEKNSQTCSSCQVLDKEEVRTYFLDSQENSVGKTLTFYVEACEISKMPISSCN